jgi:phenylalanyl-tRNA synthetase beta chain
MKIPLSWLKEYVDLPDSPEKIADILTLAGLEVDEIKSVGGSFTGVVIGKVLKSSPLPETEKLKITEVSDGTEVFQVVCGAPNCKEGAIVAFAKIGATLTEPDGKILKIRKGKLRGIESFGMLCGADELGLGDDTSGILELPDHLELGTDLSSLYADTVFDISLTPNLGHCMSVYGVARELAAFFKTPIKPLFPSTLSRGSFPISDRIQVTIKDEDNCQKYSSLFAGDVTVGPSPSILANRLELAGLRSVNNVVDISNYMMLLTGQPLHFFDYDLIEGKQVFISSSQEEKVQTLDQVERTLPKGALIIRDAKKTIAIAGILGCSNAEVSEKTKNILIEAAIFSSSSIRKTAKALNLKTDASQRFEKKVDEEILPQVLSLAASLLQKHANAGSISSSLNLISYKTPVKIIPCRKKKVQEILGISLSLSEIKEILERLEMKIIKEHLDSLEVTPPSYRNDIEKEIDLIEEVARLYGFNLIPKGKAYHTSSSLLDAPIFIAENKARDTLLREGLQEFLTCDLISPALAELTKEKTDKTTEVLTVLQSKSNDYSTLRPTMLPGLLQLVKHNLAHQNQNISGFEVGRVHFGQGDSIQEPATIGVILSGTSSPHHHDPKSKEVDFFDLKGIVENLLETFKIKKTTFEVSHLHNFQPGKQARIRSGDVFLGALGEVHPSTLKALDITQRVFFAEINLQELYALGSKKIQTTPLKTLPASERDWTLTLDKQTQVAEIFTCIEEAAPKVLERAYLLDMFESEKIGLDKKNATLRFVYRDNIKTIDFETVEKQHAKLIQKVAEKLGNCIL